MATLDEFCQAHATGAASAQRLHAVGCHTPTDLHRFTATELAALLGIGVSDAESLLGACGVAVDLEPGFDHAPWMGVLLRPERGADLELDLCLRLAQAGVTSIDDLARSSPLELARALGVDVGRLMRLVAWAEQWVEDHRESQDASTFDDVLTPAPRRSERFSPAERALGPRRDVLGVDAARLRPQRRSSAPAPDPSTRS